ncbi:MAG: hypothetical protein ACXW11_06835 [Methylotenera sp.]
MPGTNADCGLVVDRGVVNSRQCLQAGDRAIAGLSNFNMNQNPLLNSIPSTFEKYQHCLGFE